MRSAVVLALVLVSACDGHAVSPQPSSENSAALPDTPSPGPIKVNLNKDLPNFQALGTEPFWSVEIFEGRLRYTTPENPDGTAISNVHQTAQGPAIRFAGTLDGKPLVLTITPGRCSDGMSDVVYWYSANLTIADRAEKGCARKR